VRNKARARANESIIIPDATLREEIAQEAEEVEKILRNLF
jgi:hypothetical protein